MDRKLENILLSVQKPSKYTGGEYGSIVKKKENIDVRFAFCFPDTYEVGMSHLGMKILYGLLNQRDDIWCERVFTPWVDMEEAMRANNIPLYALESMDPIRDFDMIGFTLQYELSYTNILTMLDLAGLPLKAEERTSLSPLVIAGGPCAYNPEPLADFIDIFVLGEGEEVTLELVDLYKQAKNEHWAKQKFLLEAVKIEGIYVPSLYTAEYNEDGTLKSFEPNMEGVPKRVRKRIIKDLDSVYYPDKLVMPFSEAVHDRVMLEIFRGCIRGCRFCQAGMVYRPVREKSREKLNRLALDLCENTGYEEISLSSLSTSDYNDIANLTGQLLEWTEKKNISLALPSLRADNFPEELFKRVEKIRKTGLTFAPEAGTQKLRDVINKNLSEDEILSTCRTAFKGGHSSVKLYFMVGLPTETNEDVEAIPALGQKVVNEYYNNPDKPKGKSVNVTVSVSNFVPKPFTPFQWEAQDDMETLKSKHQNILSHITTRKINSNWHDEKTSFLEAVMARGDRKVCKVIYEAYKSGCKFDGWDEMFRFDIWMKAFDTVKVDPDFYATRKRDFDELLPWDFIDIGVTRKFLQRQAELAYRAETSPNCREKCTGCGASVLGGGVDCV